MLGRPAAALMNSFSAADHVRDLRPRISARATSPRHDHGQCRRQHVLGTMRIANANPRRAAGIRLKATAFVDAAASFAQWATTFPGTRNQLQLSNSNVVRSSEES